jgi:RNA polymerase sigma-70 factor (ECF subfamily)
MDLARVAGQVEGDIPSELGEDTPHSIVLRLQRADASAITLVYRQHHLAVRAFAQRLVGDVEAAEDLVQDVFVALPTAISRFRGDCALRTFLVSIAVNHAKNHVRAAARRRAALARLAREPSPASPDPHSQIERRELKDRLMLALDELPLEQRVAVVLSEIEERTSTEIATIVGAPEGTVRTRIFHAKRKLREILRGEGSSASAPRNEEPRGTFVTGGEEGRAR